MYRIDARHEDRGNNWDSDYVGSEPIKHLRDAKAYLRRLCNDVEWAGWEFRIMSNDDGAEVERDSNSLRVARVFEESTGKYHHCADSLDYLDARGTGHTTKASALHAAYHNGYTHAVGSGCTWQGVKRIPARFRS
jgi:hypothetical protein